MSGRITREELGLFIQQRDFSGLFIALGWDRHALPTAPLSLTLDDDRSFAIDRVVEKRGFVVCVCEGGGGGGGDDYPSTKADRRRLVNKLAGHHYEHLLIICGEGKQCWTVAIRPQNRPLRTVEVEWNEQQDIQPLMEKLDGMIFDISEEDNLGITDVVDRVRSVFMEGAEKVTKKFYLEFSKELSAFAKFIKGIREQVSKEWYAALMLNRLMFIYFIQKKNFLDGDGNYLENRLKKTQNEFGADQFHDRFYRHFLRRLFSEGLGTPESARDRKLKTLLGKVPYLNGGLFDVHQIERENDHIEIPDRAFEKLFAFFNQYNWHLDSRPTASGKDINPDVIGYIFEKYINDRAALGAYYTQEDITGYIARNTIIPFLLNRTREKCKNAFDRENGIWRFLRENPDNYIYAAVKKGCDIPDGGIPENIRCGLDTVTPNLIDRRKDWNTPAEEQFALPTEIWRETIARRNRYFALKEKIENGEVHKIDDLITHNLDIERFAADALRYYEGSDFIAAFYEAIAGKQALNSNQHSTHGITVLDPACGSGAFLFAALNILEPLYERCVERMRDFVDEDHQLRQQSKRKGAKKHPQFRVVLGDIDQHQNEKYWIYKTIILNNLFGVDLMKEAAEIAKLRLFLKLAAEAEYDPNKNNHGLEPLPDIDFNIRSGNSLVGYASMAQFEAALTPDKGQMSLDLSGGLVNEIREQAELVQKANESFRRAQDSGGEDYRQAKIELSKRLAALNSKMNHYLANQYGKNEKQADYNQWLKSHQPFHWLAEFYGIIEQDGGFDVVIGNPPYVEYRKVKKDYTVKDYKTESCRNLYAYFMERNLIVSHASASVGNIIPVSVVSTSGYSSLRNLYINSSKCHISSYNIHPCCLFEGANPRLSIIISSKTKTPSLFTTRYQKWFSGERDFLFSKLIYFKTDWGFSKINTSFIPKIGTESAQSILQKISSKKTTLSAYMDTSKHAEKSNSVYYRRVFGKFLLFYESIPEMYDEQGSPMIPTELKELIFRTPYNKMILGVYYSSVFYFVVCTQSDCRNINRPQVRDFNINFNEFDANKMSHLSDLSSNLWGELIKNSKMMDYAYSTGQRKFRAVFPQKSKSIIDKIDAILANHYGFTEEQLDYIINYDIKYRMGLK